MPSESIAASWHPAMMPNSMSDSVEQPPRQPSQSGALPAEDDSTEDSMLDSRVIVAQLDTENVRAGNAQTEDLTTSREEDDGADAGLDGFRSALTTSLKSPRGVELQESLVHKGVDLEDPVQGDAEFPLAEFPSEGPKHENKHLSTMSFARTVSDDVNWGEDDEVDPEWNLSRNDTDPFKMMATSDRTNSFPAVPPLHRLTQNNGDEAVPRSQVESIMNEIEQEPRDLFADDDDNDTSGFFRQAADTDTNFETMVQSESASLLGESSPNFGQSYGGDYEQTEDQEMARYEEGVPLVQEADERQNGHGESVFPADEAGGVEDDFFAQVSKSHDVEQHETYPPVLERKSTVQVMESLHLQSQDNLPESPMEPPPEQQSDSKSLHRAIGGGIAASASTIISQVLGDPDAPIHQHSENCASLAMDSVEIDLAEKWKAALAGDEFLEDDDDELLPDDDSAEGTNALDPAALFGSDDEGFLEDTEDLSGPEENRVAPMAAGIPNINGHTNLKNRPTSSGNRYLPAGATSHTAPLSMNSYAPYTPLFTDLLKSTTASQLPPQYGAPPSALSQSQELRPGMPKAQSFANRSKGGYQSPYDLPIEVVKPRKRASVQNLGRGFSTGPSGSVPPPRSSSMNPQVLPPPRGLTASSSPPTCSDGQTQQQQYQQPRTSIAPPTRSGSSGSGFFEDLPVSSRPKPAPRNATYAPTSSTSYGKPAGPPPKIAPLSGQPLPPVQYQQHSHPPPTTATSVNLVAPERVSPYASLPSNSLAQQPATASRYSPAPPQPQPHSQNAPLPVAQSRYSPAPPASLPRQQSQPFVPPPVLAHQPRTSSPLAQFERTQDPRSYKAEPANDRRVSSSGYESNLRSNTLPPTEEVDESELASEKAVLSPPINGSQQSQHAERIQQSPQTPPPPQAFGARPLISPSKRQSYLPQQHLNGKNGPASFVPPRRSLTQSPGSAFSGPKLEMNDSAPYPRPASVEAPTSPRVQVAHSTYQPMAEQVSTQNRARATSRSLSYVVPNDGREHDPLQRWKGAPVFVWGVGGTLVTSFPKDVPRYGMNQNVPMIIRSPGEVKIGNIKSVDPLPERLTSFPGPLKGKSKKKEVVAWLNSGVDILEQNALYLRTAHSLTHEDKRTEERILLWKILRVFIENDGTLEGNATVDKAVRAVISPGLDSDSTTNTDLYATGAELSGISHSSDSATRPDPVDPMSVEQLRKHLLRGEREKAVWEAVDKRLWAHAMLISNTVSRELYKQVAQEFVQKEVRNIGDNTESLAALYAIFAGNFEESIDELVPSSARAGFQMISTSNSTGPSKDAMEGLDRWRETLGLVLSNRSVDDVQALNALGKLLSGYGRAEAAHICFLFGRSVSNFGGIDDPASSIVLIGSDHLRQPFEFDKELEPILLSEVYEYGMSLASTANVTVSYPHLAIYKLQHATILAEYGHRERALQYCESVASSVTSQTKRSPYHHALFVSALDDLSKRLKQSPKSEASSWLSKPTVSQVSGSVWDKLSKFVAGDEDDTTTGGAASLIGGSDVGPFSNIAGGTPTISRSPSNSDIHGGYNGGLTVNSAMGSGTGSKTTSRYAPGRAYTPEPQSGGSYVSQPRTSMESRSSGEHQRYQPQRQMSDYRPGSQPAQNGVTAQTPASYTPQTSYFPLGINNSPEAAQQDRALAADPYNPSQSMINSNNVQPASASYTPSEQFQYTPVSYGLERPAAFNSPSGSYGYEPPSLNQPAEGSTEQNSTSFSNNEIPYAGYDPPTSSYTPYEPSSMMDEPASPIDTKPKKKSFMDDDEDDIPILKSAPASGEKTKAEKDREADEAFRKAAEADGK
jgi:hypothetical protein